MGRIRHMGLISHPISSSNREFIFELLHGQFLAAQSTHMRAARSARNRFFESLQGVRVPLGFDLDRAIGGVPGVARNSKQHSLDLTKIPEAHALHAARDTKPYAPHVSSGGTTSTS